MNDIYEKQCQDKAAAEQARNCATQAQYSGNLAGAAMGLVGRPSLRDNIRSQRERAEREGSKAYRLSELEHLLDKNPEVARILDLIEEVGR